MFIEIREIKYDSPEYTDEVHLRYKVLREPLGLQFLPEDLKQDVDDIHLCVFLQNKIIACLMLKPLNSETIKMRQVAVDLEHQKSGIGKKLVKYSEEIARQKGFTKIVLNARMSAVPFYLNLDYEIYDEPFEEVTLPHRKMRKKI